MPVFVATHRLVNFAMHPIHCAKVDVRTHCRKGYMRRASPIHHLSQGRRRTHTAPPSFSPGTELHDHPTLSVPRPIYAAPHLRWGRNTFSESVATIGCKRDAVCGGAVATSVPHPLMGDGFCLRTVESHCATRRCRTPPGTASPDAVPQIYGRPNLRPTKP